MTTGHAPDESLDLPALDADPDTPSEPEPEDEWETGELQVVDVDVDDAEETGESGDAGETDTADAEPESEPEPEPEPGDIAVTGEMATVEVPEPALPPMVEPPKRVRAPVWKVPVLTSKRDKSQAPPPDALRPESESEPAPAAKEVVEPAVTEPVPAVPDASAPEVEAQPEPAEVPVAAAVAEPVAEPEVEGQVAGVSPEVLAEPMPEIVAPPPPPPGDGGLGPRARRRIEAQRARRGRVRKQRTVTVVAMAVLIAAGGGLALFGVKEVRGSTGGKYVDNQLQPDQPGYVALVTPTPALLVVHKGPDGELAGLSLLTLRSQDEGGSVLVMPVNTVAPFADVGTTFADVYTDGGADGVASQVEFTLNITIAETVEVDDVRWASLVDPVAPLGIELDAPAGDFTSGDNELTGDQVGPFLETRDDDETELARLDRQELFWETWLPMVAGGGQSAVPGEVDVGLGRFVRGLAAGEFEVTSLPVAAAFSADEQYAPSEEMLPTLVAQTVPYPQEPSRGSRVQTQLLNGTTQTDLNARAATRLVAGGAEIALVGNASSFDQATTRFVYSDAKTRDDAQQLRDAFGVGQVEQAPGGDEALPVEEDRIDVTVILGADALDALGG